LAVDIFKGDRYYKLLVDTGATVSVLRRGIGKIKTFPSKIKAKGVTSNQLEIIGQRKVKIRVGKRELEHEFIVCTLPMKFDGIVGIDLLRKLGAKIDVCNG
jgi:predicted aspartyl protease